MKYIISHEKLHQHLIDLQCIIENVNSKFLEVHLPAWRPGRYELGNFAKNIQKWVVTNEKGDPLKSEKINKDCWRITVNNSENVLIHYNYYASELNAGSSYIDEKQLYINPVNCLLYVKERMNEEHILELSIPDDFKVATGLKKKTKTPNIFSAKNYDELADSPLIASNSIKRNHFVYEGIEFNLWFQGECLPDWGKIICDFFIFVNEQYELFGEFPVKEYHFLFQILPYKFHHGVEHLNSTVIALGPGYNLLNRPLYDEFLGVSSHELFHSWNIKSIRPIEMMPYDFSRENYSRLGYVAEGVTTYYGDLMLFRSGIQNEEEYLKKLSESLQRHFDNFGRNHRSIAESSFDTWLDGYGNSIPNRVMSIYPDGCILAFITDILIRKNSENKSSLDDVMRILYHDFAKKGRGYSEQEYKNMIEKVAEKNMDNFFEKYVWGNKLTGNSPIEIGSYEVPLNECLSYIGCELIKTKSPKFQEAHWGIKTSSNPSGQKSEIVSAIYPGSVAAKAGLCHLDEIISINGFELKNDLAEWSRYFSFNEIKLLIKRKQELKEIKIKASKDTFYQIYSIQKNLLVIDEKKENFMNWCGKKL